MYHVTLGYKLDRKTGPRGYHMVGPFLTLGKARRVAFREIEGNHRADKAEIDKGFLFFPSSFGVEEYENRDGVAVLVWDEVTHKRDWERNQLKEGSK